MRTQISRREALEVKDPMQCVPRVAGDALKDLSIVVELPSYAV